MGLFGESRKEREEREERALSLILKQFETDLSAKSSSGTSKSTTPSPQPPPTISLTKSEVKIDDLARFLAQKGILNYPEWENYLRSLGKI